MTDFIVIPTKRNWNSRIFVIGEFQFRYVLTTEHEFLLTFCGTNKNSYMDDGHYLVRSYVRTNDMIKSET